MGREKSKGKVGKMNEKVLVLNRKKSTLEIQDEDNDCCFSYIEDITHIEKDETEYGIKNRIFDIYNGGVLAGFVTNVKEVQEEW